MTNQRTIGIAIAALLTLGLVGAACGGTGPSPTPTPTATAKPTATATPRPTATPTATPVSEETSHISDPENTDTDEEQFLLGERIFKTDAGDGIGCQYCHGPEGRGNIGPNIRGKFPGDIRFALESVGAMEFLRLGQKKVEAVSVYLRWLATQP